MDVIRLLFDESRHTMIFREIKRAYFNNHFLQLDLTETSGLK